MAFPTWRVSSSACLEKRIVSCAKGRRTRGLVVRLVGGSVRSGVRGALVALPLMRRVRRPAREGLRADRDLLDAGVLVGERVGHVGEADGVGGCAMA